jgi:putative ABC transport system substrate-binding protein
VALANPIGSGIVKSLARPAGNVTGTATLSEELSPKLLELLTTVVPKLSRVAVLTNPTNLSQRATVESVQSAASKLRVNILPIEAQDLIGIEDGFELMRKQHVGAVIVLADSIFNNHRRPIAELVSKNRIPSMFAWKQDVQAGGLMSYGPNLLDLYRRAATYVDKILKGANPGDLPIEQPIKFDLVVNLKTAKELGIKIPQAVLLSATEVIE